MFCRMFYTSLVKAAQQSVSDDDNGCKMAVKDELLGTYFSYVTVC